MRLLTLALAVLLGLVQSNLWFGRGSVPRVMELRAQLEEQKSVNEVARARNERLAAEVVDLKEGLEIIEEKARFELGMVKPDEIMVQISAPKR